jgi:hypothetical protein
VGVRAPRGGGPRLRRGLPLGRPLILVVAPEPEWPRATFVPRPTGLGPLVRLEAVVLLDRHPGKVLQYLAGGVIVGAAIYELTPVPELARERRLVLVLAVLGASGAFASDRVPGLTVPPSHEGMRPVPAQPSPFSAPWGTSAFSSSSASPR